MRSRKVKIRGPGQSAVGGAVNVIVLRRPAVGGIGEIDVIMPNAVRAGGMGQLRPVSGLRLNAKTRCAH